MLVGVRDRNRDAVDRRQSQGVVGGSQHPEATRAASPTNVGSEAGDEVHVAVAGQQPRMHGQTGLTDTAEALLHLGQGALDEVLQVLPVGGVTGRGVGGENDFPSDPIVGIAPEGAGCVARFLFGTRVKSHFCIAVISSFSAPFTAPRPPPVPRLPC